ncbi:MAG: hypothetical protein ACLQQ4_19570 [Bacteroidia bacterium]
MIADYFIPKPIEKEYVAGLHYPTREVLSTPEEIQQRREDAERGMVLGNNYKSKVKILFKDDESVKQVETTIWAVTDTRVILKNNMAIPLHRIIKVKTPTESLRIPNI